MSQELARIRAGLIKVPSDLKQGKPIPAAVAVRDGARIFGRVAMIKKEQEELVTLLQNACEHMRYNKSVTALFPLAIMYTPGREDEIIDIMNQLIGVLEEASVGEAVVKHKAYQTAQLEKGRNELRRGAVDEARRTLGQLGDEYSGESNLLLNIGEEFMDVRLYEDASHYLSKASVLAPEDAHTLNRLGIAKRKLRRFEEAEQAYLKAMQLEKFDPNLYFNVGRLYLDWERWEKAAYYAQMALERAPEFEEAAKMAAYAEKRHKERVIGKGA